MGDIEQKIDRTHNLTVISAKGVLSCPEILNSLEQFYGNNPTELLIWDFSDVVAVDLAYEDLVAIVSRIRQIMETRKRGRTALVKSKQVNAGLGKMFSAVAGIAGLPYEYRVCATLEDARQWLGLR